MYRIKKEQQRKYLNAVSGNLTDLVKKQHIYSGNLSSIKDPNLFNSIMNILEENHGFIKQDEKGNRMYSNALHHYNNYLDFLVQNNIEKINKNKKMKVTTKEAIIQARIGQGKFRNELLEYWKQCSVTGCKTQPLLVASHIKPWSDSDDSEKLDKFNGLLLLSNIDKAFDSGLITFENNGKL